MSFRFICPHCRVAIDPDAMETSCGEGTEFRVCPCCDSPVPVFSRDDQAPQCLAAEAKSVSPIFEAETLGADLADREEAEA